MKITCLNFSSNYSLPRLHEKAGSTTTSARRALVLRTSCIYQAVIKQVCYWDPLTEM